MKVQNIAKTSIYTKGNGYNGSVSFAGKKAKQTMPKYSAHVAGDAKTKTRTSFDELCDLAVKTKNAIKKSYDKSEIKRVIVQPAKQAWNKFSKKAPVLSGSLKGLGYLAVGAGIGLGIVEAIDGKNR